MKQDISSHLMAFREYFTECFETGNIFSKRLLIKFNHHNLNDDVNKRSHDSIRIIFTRESDARKTKALADRN